MANEQAVMLGEIEGSVFMAVTQGYELQTANPQPGETVFSAVGKFATRYDVENYGCFENFEPGWQLVLAEHWVALGPRDPHREDPYRWASAEELRTEASEGTFDARHMNLLDAWQFREQRVTSAATKLTIASEDELRVVLEHHDVSTKNWTDGKVHDLYNYTRSNNPDMHSSEVENMTLHSVDGRLWLSTAQTMLNVYHQDETGQAHRLQETWIIPFDHKGVPLDARRSKLRSSMGETGHLVGDKPESSWLTARRCLFEEAGIEEDDVIVRIVSTGSILRRKAQGHHQYGPEIATEDRTHYFNVELDSSKVETIYENREYDPDGRLRAIIELEWHEHDMLPTGLRVG